MHATPSVTLLQDTVYKRGKIEERQTDKEIQSDKRKRESTEKYLSQRQKRRGQMRARRKLKALLVGNVHW